MMGTDTEVMPCHGLKRVKAAINWEKPDRVPVQEDFWTEVPKVWAAQGLPESMSLTPPEDHKAPLGDFVDEFFDFDISVLYLDASPRLPQEIVSRDGEWYTYTDRYGYRAQKFWEHSGTLEFLSNVTDSREAWEELKPRFSFDPAEPARIDDRNYFEHFTPYPSRNGAVLKAERLAATGNYILAKNYGPWEATWRHREFTRLLMDIAMEPQWVSDMAWTHHGLSKKILKQCIDDGMTIHGYFMVDDLGSSGVPLISPEMFRQVLKPIYADMGAFLAKEGIDFWLHSCGNTELLFEDYIECGIQVINPLQVSAGLDILELKEKYRGRLAFFGNIDAHLFGGKWEPLARAVEERLHAFQEGGWICHSDHSVPPTMKYNDYLRLLKLIRQGE